MLRAASSRSRCLANNGASAGSTSSRALSPLRLSSRFEASPASISGSPAAFARCTAYSPIPTSTLAAITPTSSRVRHPVRRAVTRLTSARSLDLLRVTGISVRLRFDLHQPEVHAIHAVAHAYNRGVRVPVRRDLLVQLQRMPVVVGR